MKRSLFTISSILLFNVVAAQVAINTDATAAHGSAMLDIKSSNKGFLPPRMSWTQIQAIPSPAKGLIVFDEGLSALRFFDGNKWIVIGPKKNDLYGPPGDFKLETASGAGQANCLETLISSNKTIYVAGTYSFGSIRIGNTDLPNPGGGNDLFISAFDSLANFLWVKTLSGDGGENITEMKLDQSGNILVCGNFSGTVDLDPGAGVNSHTASGTSQDAFFAKYDINLNLIWGRHAGSTGDDRAMSIISDLTGNVFVTGIFSLTVDFDPGGGVANLVSAGNYDIFIARYDISGNWNWSNRIGNALVDEAIDIELLNGTILVAGNFNGTVDFDFSAGTSNLNSAGSSDVFFARYDIAGAFIWAKRIGGTLADALNDIVVDPSGNFWLLGRFEGTPDFDPDLGVVNLTASANDNTFFAKYTSTGAITFAKSIVTALGVESPSEIHVNASGNAYICGSYAGTGAQTDFEPHGPVISRNSNIGSYDVFIAKYDAGGSLLWIADMGGNGFDVCNAFSITTDSKLIFVAGWVNSVVYFGFNGEKIANSNTFLIARYEE